MATGQDNLNLDQDEVHEVESGAAETGERNVKYETCEKNPGHKGMFLVKDVTLGDLPLAWQFLEMFISIMTEALLVVKIKVPFVSKNRPVGYPFYKNRGQWINTWGSGFVVFPPEFSTIPIDCPLENCDIIDKPHKTTPMFEVETSCHVVWDDEEAKRLTVEFFYDSEDDVEQNVIRGQGVRIVTTGKSQDVCRCLCVSHNLDLIKKITSFPQYKSVLDAIRAPFLTRVPKDPLVVVISHPHGHYKHVAWGEWVGFSKGGRSEDMKLGDFIRHIEQVSPQWRETGGFVNGFFLNPLLIQRWKSAVDKDPEILISEFQARRGFGRSVEENYDYITYSKDLACPGSSGARVMIFLPGREGKPWVCAGKCRHYRYRPSLNLNTSGYVILLQQHEEEIAAVLKGRVEHVERTIDTRFLIQNN